MLDLYDEFKAIVSALSEQAIDYAVCGGLAVSVYSEPRATVDIDLLIRPDDLERARIAVQVLGYTITALPMTFAHGAIEIRRYSKLDPEAGDVLTLDLLLVTPEIVDVWDSRCEIESEHGPLCLVSRRGLIALKSLRASGQDLDDIERLKEGLDES
ncbi:MAG TPA: hypothetical protein VI837_02360 [Blastocatellia bacterium]|nr:hypothetical protein [Blastocatellia bacterium]